MRTKPQHELTDDELRDREIRASVQARYDAREPLTDEEALERWIEAGRVLRRRNDLEFRCLLDLAEVSAVPLSERGGES